VGGADSGTAATGPALFGGTPVDFKTGIAKKDEFQNRLYHGGGNTIYQYRSLDPIEWGGGEMGG